MTDLDTHPAGPSETTRKHEGHDTMTMIHTLTLEIVVNDADAATVVLQALTDMGHAMASGAAEFLVEADISHTMIPDRPETLVPEVTLLAPPDPPSYVCTACGYGGDEGRDFEVETGTGATFCTDREACGARIEVAIVEADVPHLRGIGATEGRGRPPSM